MSEKVWILTREINAYDQEGAYFVCAFKKQPTIAQLAEVMKKESHGIGGDVMEAVSFLENLRNGGGRRDTEYRWYNLDQEDLLGV